MKKRANMETRTSEKRMPKGETVRKFSKVSGEIVERSRGDTGRPGKNRSMDEQEVVQGCHNGQQKVLQAPPSTR